MNANDIPRWTPCGEHGAVLKDKAGLVYGNVRQFYNSTTMWIGLAITGEPISGPGDYTGVSHIAPTKEKAMQFVVDKLTEQKRL